MMPGAAAGDRVGDDRAENGDDDADDDLGEPTLHDVTIPDPNGKNMKRGSMNTEDHCFPSRDRQWPPLPFAALSFAAPPRHAWAFEAASRADPDFRSGSVSV